MLTAGGFLCFFGLRSFAQPEAKGNFDDDIVLTFQKGFEEHVCEREKFECALKDHAETPAITKRSTSCFGKRAARRKSSKEEWI